MTEFAQTDIEEYFAHTFQILIIFYLIRTSFFSLITPLIMRFVTISLYLVFLIWIYLNVFILDWRSLIFAKYCTSLIYFLFSYISTYMISSSLVLFFLGVRRIKLDLHLDIKTYQLFPSYLKYFFVLANASLDSDKHW